MPVTVETLDAGIKRSAEEALNKFFELWEVGDLVFSQTCASLMLDSLNLLQSKEAQQQVLSSSTFFLATMIYSREIDARSLLDPDRVLEGELAQLREWGQTLTGPRGELLDRLEDEFLAPPARMKGEQEAFAETPPKGITIGPGLARGLRTASLAGPITGPELIRVLVDDQGSGIGRRLRGDRFRPLLDMVLGPSAEQSGRHPRMTREAEEDELVLGVRDYAKAVATVLRAAKGEFTFALFGRWGSGKTTLISQLEPLLRDDRRYRDSIGAPDGTAEPYARLSYRVAIHNAWKYPSRPEAWVYAYKGLADEAARSFGPIGRLLLAIRTSAHRRGLWPIAGALMILALIAIPFTAKVQLLVLALSVFGFWSMLYLGAVTTSVSAKVRTLFAKHLRLTQVDERLGMLALIGDDVRALLAAWTIGMPGEARERAERDFPPGRFVLPMLAVGAVAALWLIGLLPASPADGGQGSVSDLIPVQWAEAFGLLQDGRPGPVFFHWLLFGLWLALVFAMLALPWLVKHGRPNRVLMVIDDLDRCTASEMLDVIEGMKLLVDDSTVNTRLQVMMLVDESILDHAIALRYASLIKERASGLEDDALKTARAKARNEVIIEQNEKLFACHLRLAALAAEDVEQVVVSLAGREQRQRDLKAARDQLLQAQEEARAAEDAYQRVANGVPEYVPEVFQGTAGPGLARAVQSPEERAKSAEIAARNIRRAQQSRDERLRDHPDVEAQRDRTARALAEAESQLRAASQQGSEAMAPAEPLFGEADVRFTTAEIEDLRGLVPAFLATVGRRPSPRAIRILLFKIQLCRLLLQLRHPQEHRGRTVAEIMRALERATAPLPPMPETAAIRIARQVI